VWVELEIEEDLSVVDREVKCRDLLSFWKVLKIIKRKYTLKCKSLKDELLCWFYHLDSVRRKQ